MEMKNIKPRTREEREAMREKDQIEKRRINQRNGYESRNQDLKSLVHNPNPQSTVFMPENERFSKDFAEHDKKVREEHRLKKDMIVEKHRMEQLERENQKWERIDQQEKINQNKQEYHRQVLQAGKRNKNGVPYNPITLQYENSNDGQLLRQKDDEAKVRGLIRSGNLDSRNNCGYNVITGEVRKGVEVPSNLYNQFEQKVKQYEQHYTMQPPHK